MRAILPCPRVPGRRTPAGDRRPVSCLPLTNKAIWQAGGCRVHPGHLCLRCGPIGCTAGDPNRGARPGGPPVRHCRPAVHSRDMSAARCDPAAPKPHDARCGTSSAVGYPHTSRSGPRCQGAHTSRPGRHRACCRWSVPGQSLSTLRTDGPAGRRWNLRTPETPRQVARRQDVRC